jgi:N-acyl-D-aspartate/D-glutamate deacylase
MPRDRAACPVPVCRVAFGEREASETTDFFGFADRAHVAAGLRADVNLIDFDRLRLHQPEVVADLPAPRRAGRRPPLTAAGRSHRRGSPEIVTMPIELQRAQFAAA